MLSGKAFLVIGGVIRNSLIDVDTESEEILQLLKYPKLFLISSSSGE